MNEEKLEDKVYKLFGLFMGMPSLVDPLCKFHINDWRSQEAWYILFRCREYVNDYIDELNEKYNNPNYFEQASIIRLQEIFWHILESKNNLLNFMF